MAKSYLDDRLLYNKQDPQNMLAHIKDLRNQYARAWEAALAFHLSASYRSVNKIVVLGMGGSAIGGDLARTLLLDEMKIPVFIQRDYSLPLFVDDDTLLIASSYSGNTEETLSGFEPALKTGAKKIVITTGGTIGQLADATRVPTLKIEYQSQPRAAIGFSLISMLGIFQQLGFIKDKSAAVTESIHLLEKLETSYAETVPELSNPAKQMARRLYSFIPVIFGAGFTTEVARRWKGQFNENAKNWAIFESFPELNHNTTVGFPHPKDLATHLRVLMLRSPLYNERVKLRIDVTAQLLKESGVPCEYVDAAGESPLAQMTGLINLGDYVSYYLAILNKVDPTPVAAINYLKERLGKG